jgi:ABC-2 type transport system ATP-binding protein
MIKTENLTRRYGDLVAVDSLSITVEPGQVLGFLGPNGAGKTTTMRMIAGFIAPSSGTVSVCGHSLTTDTVAAQACMGYLPEGAPGYDEMTVAGFLRFTADIRGLAGERRRSRMNDVTERLHLAPVLRQRLETLSKGFRRRVGLAQAIIHDPKVLILDEPTDGLDPNQKQEVRQLIREMAADKIIVISTHILEEVEALCNRVMIIAHGRLLADDTPDGLIARSRYHNAVSLSLTDDSADKVKTELAALKQVGSVDLDEATGRITAFPSSDQPLLPEISRLASDLNWSLKELHLESGRMEEVFQKITTGNDA